LVNKNVPLARQYINDAKIMWSEEAIYSTIFLDLYAFKYKKARKRMRKVLKNNFLWEHDTCNEIINFLDKLLIEEPKRIEFIYRQWLLYYNKLNNLPMGLIKLETYNSMKLKPFYEYELWDIRKLIWDIEKTIW
jgi:hypothetical protein